MQKQFRSLHICYSATVSSNQFQCVLQLQKLQLAGGEECKPEHDKVPDPTYNV